MRTRRRLAGSGSTNKPDARAGLEAERYLGRDGEIAARSTTLPARDTRPRPLGAAGRARSLRGRPAAERLLDRRPAPLVSHFGRLPDRIGAAQEAEALLHARTARVGLP